MRYGFSPSHRPRASPEQDTPTTSSKMPAKRGRSLCRLAAGTPQSRPTRPAPVSGPGAPGPRRPPAGQRDGLCSDLRRALYRRSHGHLRVRVAGGAGDYRFAPRQTPRPRRARKTPAKPRQCSRCVRRGRRTSSGMSTLPPTKASSAPGAKRSGWCARRSPGSARWPGRVGSCTSVIQRCRTACGQRDPTKAANWARGTIRPQPPPGAVAITAVQQVLHPMRHGANTVRVAHPAEQRVVHGVPELAHQAAGTRNGRGYQRHVGGEDHEQESSWRPPTHLPTIADGVTNGARAQAGWGGMPPSLVSRWPRWGAVQQCNSALRGAASLFRKLRGNVGHQVHAVELLGLRRLATSHVLESSASLQRHARLAVARRRAAHGGS